ncbi:MAG TPA: hypothetical protein PLQ93_12940 [Bacteroidia bacterium]|nr:hypothetical protein [Bacteroidia bacterium]
MRSGISILIVFCLAFNKAKGQDTLSIIGSGTFLVNVTEVGPYLVKFKFNEEPKGLEYTVVKSAVVFIHYRDGSLEDLSDMLPEPDTMKVDWVEKGKLDAKLNYVGKNSGAFWVGGATILFTPVLGWIPALAFACIPPSECHLNIMDYKLRRNKPYYESYLD